MSIQLLGLRDNPSKKGRKYETFFDKGWRAPSVPELFRNSEEYLKKIPEKEHFNLYYTVASCLEEPGRKLASQDVCPFDIDGIDTNRVDDYIEPILAALGVSYEKTGIIFSGNGLQFIVCMVDPINDVAYFKKNRSHYKSLCTRIDKALKNKGLKGSADTSVFSPARLMRLAGTENRKPHGTTKAVYIQRHIEPVDFVLEDRSSFLPNAPGDLKKFATPDTPSVLAGCDFLKHCKDKPEEIKEPAWYAMLSIVARLKEGTDIAHEYSKGHPDYTREDTEDKINQALDASGPRGCQSISSLWDGCKNCEFHNKVTNPILIKSPDHIATIDNGFYTPTTDAQGNPKPGKPCYEDLRMFYNKQNKYISLMETDLVYKYVPEDHYWVMEWDSVLKHFAYKNMDPKPTNNMRNEFMHLVQITNLKSQDWFHDSARGKLNFANGVFDMNDLSFSQPSEEYGFKYRLDYDFDAKAKCPTFEKFVSEVTDNRSELVTILQEFMGYCISNEDPEMGQKALVLLGDGANGKSVFMDVMKMMAGEKNYSSLNLGELQQETNRLQLDGKLFNISEETPDKSLRDSSLFKTLVTGGEVMVKMLYKQPFRIKNFTKLVLSCNKLPENIDFTHGMFRRLIIVPFDVTFTDEKGNRDPDMRRKLYAELPGIFNWAIEGYTRFRKSKRFSGSNILEQTLNQYRLETDTVLQWMNESIEFTDGEEFIETTKLYKDYVYFCDEANERPLKRLGFSKRIKLLDEFTKRYKRMESARGYSGIKLREAGSEF